MEAECLWAVPEDAPTVQDGSNAATEFQKGRHEILAVSYFGLGGGMRVNEQESEKWVLC